MHGATRSILAVLAISAVSATLAGCSGSSNGGVAQSATTTGPSPTSSTPSGSTSTGDTGTGQGGDLTGKQLASTVTSAVRSAGRARFTLSETGTKGRGVIDESGSAPKVSLTLTQGGSRIGIVQIPAAMYVKSGQIVQGKHWVRIPAGTSISRLKRDRDQLLGVLYILEPSAQASAWASVDNFAQKGTATVGGVSATEYEGTVSKAEFKRHFKNAPGLVKGLKSGSKYQIWLDAKGRPVKVVWQALFSEGLERDTTTYTGWGSAPAVKTPPSGDVLSVPNL